MNVKLFLLAMMFLGHLLADYPLQGWLATAKAKKYWESAPPMNRHDYVAALICHSAMWGIVMFLPLITAPFWMEVRNIYLIWILLLAAIVGHFFIDDAKANKGVINLLVDQFIHVIQIIVSWSFFIAVCI